MPPHSMGNLMALAKNPAPELALGRAFIRDAEGPKSLALLCRYEGPGARHGARQNEATEELTIELLAA